MSGIGFVLLLLYNTAAYPDTAITGWTDWSDDPSTACSVTCGNGTKTQYRKCQTDTEVGGCQGNDTRVVKCNCCPDLRISTSPSSPAKNLSVLGHFSKSSSGPDCGFVYEQTGSDIPNELFFLPGGMFWLVGRDPRMNRGHLMNRGGERCPENLTSAWEFWDDSNGGWVEDPDMVLECGIGPVDGVWSEWKDQGTCSDTCGNGEKIQRRECARPRPTNGGKDCQGPEERVAKCGREERVPECCSELLISKSGDGGGSLGSSVLTGLGMYVMEGLDNRCEPVYRQRVAESNRSSHNFLSSLTGGFWIVGTVPDTRYGQILFHGEERCPENITFPTVHYWNKTNWLSSDQISINCEEAEWSPWSDDGECSSACGVGSKTQKRSCIRGSCLGDEERTVPCLVGKIPDCCCELLLSTSRSSPSDGLVQMGRYTKVGLGTKSCGFTYKHRDGEGSYLFYWPGGWWMVGKEPEVDKGHLLHAAKATCPEDLDPGNWKYYNQNTSSWVLDTEMKLTCVGEITGEEEKEDLLEEYRDKEYYSR